MRVDQPRGRVLFVQYTSPACYPPLEHAAELLLRRKMAVAFFGLEIGGDAGALAFPDELAARCKLWRQRRPGAAQKLHYLAFVFAAWIKAWIGRADWVYVSDALAAPAGWLIMRLSPAKVLYHEHDSPKEIDAASSAVSRVIHRCRRALLTNADSVVFPNQGRCDAARPGRPAHIVWNVPVAGEAQGRAARSTAKGPLEVLYHGSIVPERVPLTLVEALARLGGRCRLHVVGYFTDGSASYATTLRDEAKRRGVEQLLVLHGAIPARSRLLDFAATCDVGLSFVPVRPSDNNLQTMAGASNKPFDYMARGLALLVTRRPDWEQMFVAPGFGRSCDPQDVESIVEHLRWFEEHRAETRAMGERGTRQIISAWNYERQFEPVATQLCPK